MFVFFNDPATTVIYTYCHTLSLHDALPIFERDIRRDLAARFADNPLVPNDLVVMLANDDIAIAEPILRRSSVLQDEELIGVIRYRTDRKSTRLNSSH